jgi:phosphomevalonate decarboxylase
MSRKLKATAVAHPIQGLIKYHGLKDPDLRIPYHDSISVCAKALSTKTTVEFREDLREDTAIINDMVVSGDDLQRIKTILSALTRIYGRDIHAKVTSRNSLTGAKGLGFSASGFAALGLAAREALGLDLDDLSLSEVVRLGAGSATRSLAGGFAIWYADRGGRSYGEQLAGPGDLDLGMVIVPIASPIRTDEAHRDVVTSPLFRARLEYVGAMLDAMKEAIVVKDIEAISRLAEEDTLNLHATTMTSSSHLVLWEPDTLRVIRKVEALRRKGLPCWYSMDTGPSVFINSSLEHVASIAAEIIVLGLPAIASEVGPRAHLV